MLINLFKTLKETGVPCTLRELLDLIKGLEHQIAFANINDDEKKKELITVKVLPKKLDEEVAELMVQGFGGTITKLTQEQADYIHVPIDGPFKEEEYKY